MTGMDPAELTRRFEAGELYAMVFDRDDRGWFFLTTPDSGKIRTPFKDDKSPEDLYKIYEKSDRVIGFRVSVFGPFTARMVRVAGAKDILWNLP